MPLAVRHGYNLTYKSTVGTGVPDCPLNRLLPYATAATLHTLHNALLRKAAQFSDLRLLFCAFFRAAKESTEKPRAERDLKRIAVSYGVKHKSSTRGRPHGVAPTETGVT